MIAVADGYTVWEALGVTMGGIIGAVGVLTAAAKFPWSAPLFRFLVADPVARWLDRRIDSKLEPIQSGLDSVNVAVNNVGPGEPSLKEKVRAVKEDVAELKQGQAEIAGEVKVIRQVLESLVQRP